MFPVFQILNIISMDVRVSGAQVGAQDAAVISLTFRHKAQGLSRRKCKWPVECDIQELQVGWPVLTNHLAA